MRRFLFLALVLPVFFAEAAEPWTTTDGIAFEADFVAVSVDGESVDLVVDGEVVTVDLDRLSENSFGRAQFMEKRMTEWARENSELAQLRLAPVAADEDEDVTALRESLAFVFERMPAAEDVDSYFWRRMCEIDGYLERTDDALFWRTDKPAVIARVVWQELRRVAEAEWEAERRRAQPMPFPFEAPSTAARPPRERPRVRMDRAGTIVGTDGSVSNYSIDRRGTMQIQGSGGLSTFQVNENSRRPGSGTIVGHDGNVRNYWTDSSGTMQIQSPDGSSTRSLDGN